MKERVDLFYLKKDKSLYAYTNKALYRDLFLKTRNMRKFKHKTIKLSKKEFRLFSERNYKSKLDIIYVSDKEDISNYVKLVCTYDENIKYTNFLDDLDDRLISSRIDLCTLGLSDEEKEAISYLTDISNSLNNQYANHNTLLIFYKLFGKLMEVKK